MAHTCNLSMEIGRLRQDGHLRPGVPDQPRQHSEILLIHKIFFQNRPGGYLALVVLDTSGAELGGLLEPWSHFKQVAGG